MKVFHSLLNQSHSVWTVSLGINTLVWHSCCNISEHGFQLSMAFFFRYLKLTFFQYLQKNLIFSLKYLSEISTLMSTERWYLNIRTCQSNESNNMHACTCKQISDWLSVPNTFFKSSFFATSPLETLTKIECVWRTSSMSVSLYRQNKKSGIMENPIQK